MTKPRVCVLAGPNGAGKTTVARALVRDELGIRKFVNADVIAQGLSGFDVAATAIAAGRLMLQQIDDLAEARVDFAFETTLSARSFLPWLARLHREGYEVLLVFVWLRDVELSIQRVAERVRSGGHDIPEPVIRRRFQRGFDNFVRHYRQRADRWWCYDNSEAVTRLVAFGSGESDGERAGALAADSAMSDTADVPDDLTVRLTKAMHKGVQQARAMHKALGQPIVIWRDGRVVWVDAETLQPVPASGELSADVVREQKPT